TSANEFDLKVFDLTGCTIIPGFVDIHEHLTGGGGELGPQSRAPEAQFDDLIRGGITTVVGVLGTDSVTRSEEALLAKVRGLIQEGISAWMLVGAYNYPPTTISGSVRKDIVTVEQVLGVGEIAISDHRGSHPSIEELARVASEARVGGMLAGKAGIVHCHIGSGKSKIDDLWTLIDRFPIPIGQFSLTHMNRNSGLVYEAAKWLKAGGWIDFTIESAVKQTIESVKELRKFDPPLPKLTLSSDAYGSLPRYDEGGNILKYEIAHPRVLLDFLCEVFVNKALPIATALPLLTSNPATLLGLVKKGRIAEGCDADILVLDDMGILRLVFARGKLRKSIDISS
ncbi:MAG TPA: beta-aspartyl-peptidase, partial [Candidatus Hodarchaeales archaeon]|nr:beta-aspartyl-peptidase [Candidatus Hodarchaeales archaeon]